MYVTTLLPSAASVSASPDFRKQLSAVYRRRSDSLRELARTRVRKSADAWDAVQEAFLFVLEHPPADTSERGLTSALEAAVRAACGRQARQRADDVNLKIALQKRFPV
jgi:DNA-directed RNA polymerase specialized sigma24 family protein